MNEAISQASHSVPAWEYRIVQLWEGSDHQFNELGDQGWELVSIRALPAPGYVLAYFKRPHEYAQVELDIQCTIVGTSVADEFKRMKALAA